MIVTAIDPGFANLGYSSVDFTREARTFVIAGTEVTPPEMSFDERMDVIADRILALEGDLWCMENQERAWGGRSAARGADKNSVRVREVCGMVRLRARALGARLVVVTAQRVRAHLGLPRAASKAQMAKIARFLVRGVPEKLSNHATDAIAIGIAGAREVPPEVWARRGA